MYLLKCPCNLYYVGKTKQVKTGICEHKCFVCNNYDKSSVATHSNSHKHSEESNSTWALKQLRYQGGVVIQTDYFSKEKLIGYTSWTLLFLKG